MDSASQQEVLECPTCGASAPNEGDQFSSWSAVSKHHKLAHGESLVTEEAECLWCGVVFEYRPTDTHSGNRRHCSKECQTKSRRNGLWNPSVVEVDERTCEWCGDEYVPHIDIRNEQKYCSEECRVSAFAETASEQTGADSPVWKGGFTSVDRGENWRAQRQRALRRDQYRCQRCGVPEFRLENWLSVHHIVPFRKFDESREANKLSNLITLCISCHGKVEHGDAVINDG